MSVLSVFGGVCAFFSCAVTGLWLKKRALRKAAFYEDYCEYLQFASEKIGYERMPIGELNEKFRQRKKGEFTAFLAKENCSPPLSDVALGEISNYLSEIGTTDADTQIASLKSKCAEMKRFAEKDCVKLRKDGSLYFKLSALAGVVVFIILV